MTRSAIGEAGHNELTWGRFAPVGAQQSFATLAASSFCTIAHSRLGSCVVTLCRLVESQISQRRQPTGCSDLLSMPPSASRPIWTPGRAWLL